MSSSIRPAACPDRGCQAARSSSSALTAAGSAVEPTIQGYELVNIDNDTLEIGFHVGFVVLDGANDTYFGDAFGAVTLARYEIPVYDLLVDGGGLAVLDGDGQGQLATDAFGNLVPSTPAGFGVGSETAPVSIGLDGLRGTADDGAAIVVTAAGLFAENDPLLGSDADHTAVQGRSLSIASLHDGQLVVSYIGGDDRVHLHVYIPSIDETGDRETGGIGTDVIALGVTTYAEIDLPFPTALGVVAPSQSAITVAQQNGSFGVFWATSGQRRDGRYRRHHLLGRRHELEPIRSHHVRDRGSEWKQLRGRADRRNAGRARRWLLRILGER